MIADGANVARQRAAYDAHYAGYEASVAKVHRMFRPYTIERWRALVRGKDVLDLGCGLGYVARALLDAPVRSYLGIDISSKMIGRNSAAWQGVAGVEFRVDDAERLATCRDASCDVVVSYGCLHHLEDPQAALRAAARVLRPGGTFVGVELNREQPATGFLGLMSLALHVPLYRIRPLWRWAGRQARGLLGRNDGVRQYLESHPGHPGKRTPAEYREMFGRAGLRSASVEGLFLDLVPRLVYWSTPLAFRATVALSQWLFGRTALMDKGSVLLLHATK